MTLGPKMTQLLNRTLLLLAVCLYHQFEAAADTVDLVSGKRLEGKITSASADSLQIQVGEDSHSIPHADTTLVVFGESNPTTSPGNAEDIKWKFWFRGGGFAGGTLTGWTAKELKLNPKFKPAG